jgi:hypothetical protein
VVRCLDLIQSLASFTLLCGSLNQRFGLLDVDGQLFQLLLQFEQQETEYSGKGCRIILQNIRQRRIQVAPSCSYRDASLQQQTTDLVHYCSSSHDPAFTHSMQRLHVQLFIGLDRHEAHPWPSNGFGDGLGIDEVALVGLHKRLHVLRRNEPNFMALLAQSLAKETRSCAGFHTNHVNLNVRSETKKLTTQKLLPHLDFPGLVQSNKVKNCLTQIDADRM